MAPAIGRRVDWPFHQMASGSHSTLAIRRELCGSTIWHATPSRAWPRGRFRRLPSGPHAVSVSFTARPGRARLEFVVPAGGRRGDEVRLSKSDEFQNPLALSPDGSFLVFAEGSGPGGNLLSLPLDASAAAARPLFRNRTWGGGASFSPDGRWLAYESVESGRTEVYVRPFPEGDQRIQVSTNGGDSPVWSKSNEIFYIAAPGLTAASITFQGNSLSVSKPVVLFPTGGDTDLVAAFDVTPDGQRFLMLRSRGTQHLSFIFNWPLEVARLVARSDSADR